MMVAQESSYLCQTIILLLVIQSRTVLLCIHLHAPKLVDIEGFAKPSNTFLPEDDWFPIFPFNSNVTIEEEWREDDETDEGNNKVNNAFHIAFDHCHPVENI